MTPAGEIETVGAGEFRLGFRDLREFAIAREALAEAGYAEKTIAKVMGSIRIAVSRLAGEMPALLRRTADSTPVHTLIRLFFLEAPVDRDAAAEALAPSSLESWQEAGLLRESDGKVEAAVRIVPVGDLWMASDRLRDMHAGGRQDFVTGVGGSSLLLANVAIHGAPRKVLDLGTGCGILALRAAADAGFVIATDKNGRALEFVRFNASLNGVSNVDCREGNLFDPVAEERFDRIVCNPPYVISPSGRYVFRDSGVRGDEFCRRILREAVSFLEPSGLIQMVCNWPRTPGHTERDWLEETLAGMGCDAIAWIGAREDPSTYANTWIEDTESPGDAERKSRLYDQWVKYLEDEHIEEVTYGLIAVRRSRSGDGWVHFDDSPDEFLGPSGEFVLRGFEQQDFVRSTSDDRLLDESFRVAPDLRLERRYRPEDGQWAVEQATVSLARGPAWSVRIDSAVAALVLACDGSRPLRSLFVDVAKRMGVEMERAVPGGLAVVRRLLERGFLLRAET